MIVFISSNKPKRLQQFIVQINIFIHFSFLKFRLLRHIPPNYYTGAFANSLKNLKIFLINIKIGIFKDGKRRRRLDYKTARSIIEKAIGNLNEMEAKQC